MWRASRAARPCAASRSPIRNRYVLFGDLLVFAFAALAAFALRLDWVFVEHRAGFRVLLTASLLVKPIIFFVFNMYREDWRYASVRQFIGLVLAAFASSASMTVVVVAAMYTGSIPWFPRSVLLLDLMLTIFGAAGLRLTIRVLAESWSVARRPVSAQPPERVLVVGAGDAGVLVVREMQRNPQLQMLPVAFVDDDEKKVGKRIYSVPVAGITHDIERIVAERGIGEVIIAMPRASGPAVRAVLERCQRADVPARTMPGVFELLGGQINVSRLRKVEIADLLRRSQVLPPRGGPTYLTGRTVLVTGAGGSIGSELCRQVGHAQPAQIVLLGHGENSLFDVEMRLRAEMPGLHLENVVADVRDRTRIDQVLARYRPQVVFHAAAHKHVPLMERNAEEAITNNVFGTLNVLEAARQHHVERFVLISTDKAVSPRSVMGASKRLAETIVRHAAKAQDRTFGVVRFGNVLGSRGSVVPTFNRQIEEGGPITITHPDMKRYFMTIPEAVHLVLEAGGMERGGDLFVLNMGEPVRVVDLAEDLIRLSGLSVDDIAIVFTGPRPGERLEELLWETDAALEVMPNPDIFRVVEPESVTPQDLPRILETLRVAVDRGDVLAIRAILADAIHSFIPYDTAVIEAPAVPRFGATDA